MTTCEFNCGNRPTILVHQYRDGGEIGATKLCYSCAQDHIKSVLYAVEQRYDNTELTFKFESIKHSEIYHVVATSNIGTSYHYSSPKKSYAKIEAIKVLRALTNCGLKTAKDAIEQTLPIYSVQGVTWSVQVLIEETED